MKGYEYLNFEYTPSYDVFILEYKHKYTSQSFLYIYVYINLCLFWLSYGRQLKPVIVSSPLTIPPEIEK